MKAWGKMGAFWGGLWGLLVGSAFFMIPGLGPIIVAGPLVSAIVGGLEGAVVMGGLSALGAGLASMGIPKDSIVRYERTLAADKFLAHGSVADATRAHELLSGAGAESVDLHAEPATA